MMDKKQLRCNLCNEYNAKELFVKDSISIVRCQSCGLVYAYPQPSEEEISNLYNKEYFDGTKDIDFISEKELYFRRFEDKLEAIKPLIKTKGKLLDIGCSLGYFLTIAKNKDWQTYGVETSVFASQKARAAGLNVFIGTLEEAKYESDFFDLVTMWHIIEHLEDPMGSLKEIYRILKNNGLVVIETPNLASEGFRQKKENWEYIKPMEHLYYFTTETLKKMLEKAGFKIVDVGTLSNGTGMGRTLIKLKLFNLQKNLINIFDYLSWIKKLVLYFKKGNDLILIYARKEK